MCVRVCFCTCVCVNVFLNNVFLKYVFSPLSSFFLCLFIIHLSFCLSPLSLSVSQCLSLSVSLPSPSPSLFHSVYFPLNISLTSNTRTRAVRVSIICILRPTSRVEGGSYRGLYKAILGPRAVGAHGGLRVFLRWIRSEVGSNTNTHRPHFIFAVFFYWFIGVDSKVPAPPGGVLRPRPFKLYL